MTRIYLREFLPSNLVRLLCWGCVIAVLCAAAAAQKNSEATIAASVVHLVTTAELDYAHFNRRYATYRELVGSGQLERSARNSAEGFRVYRKLDLQTDSEPVPGFVLRIVVAGDGTAYELSLVRKAAQCGASLFSDETGVVYEGKVLDCEVEAKTWSAPNWGPPDVDEVVPGPPTVGEYRTTSDEVEPPRAQLVDTGTAAFALLFHPSLVGEFDIHCEGLTDVEARPAWQLHFAQRRDRPNQFHGFRVASNFYPIRLKGRAWIAADSYEVLRLETDLIEPIRAIRLEKEHSVIAYGPVEFAKRKVRLWLPQVAELYIDYGGHRYQRRHTFSNFHLFAVDSEEQVKLPRELDNTHSHQR